MSKSDSIDISGQAKFTYWKCRNVKMFRKKALKIAFLSLFIPFGKKSSMGFAGTPTA